jgi:hypothetical protein
MSHPSPPRRLAAAASVPVAGGATPSTPAMQTIQRLPAPAMVYLSSKVDELHANKIYRRSVYKGMPDKHEVFEKSKITNGQYAGVMVRRAKGELASSWVCGGGRKWIRRPGPLLLAG